MLVDQMDACWFHGWCVLIPWIMHVDSMDDASWSNAFICLVSIIVIMQHEALASIFEYIKRNQDNNDQMHDSSWSNAWCLKIKCMMLEDQMHNACWSNAWLSPPSFLSSIMKHHEASSSVMKRHQPSSTVIKCHQVSSSVTLDDSWWLLMTLDDSWWLLMTLDDSWWLLITHDES